MFDDKTVILDEVLEVLFMNHEDGKALTADQLLSVEHCDHEFTPEVVQRAIDSGHVARRNGHLELTDVGLKRATLVLRCNRLAERLLVDVLRVRDELVESSACRFEHILSEEVAESICTLLGHPQTCPHGKEIPPGACCQRAMTEIQQIVRPLSQFRAGEQGTVAYISSRFHDRLNRLASLGLIPGQTLQVRQIRPSFVISYGETELALEKDVANEIYLRTRSHRRPN